MGAPAAVEAPRLRSPKSESIMFLKSLTLAGAASLALLIPAAQAAQSCPRNQTFPAAEWQTATPAAAGWSTAEVEAALARAKRSWSSGVLIAGGRVIGQFGDVGAPYETRSMRKSFLNAVAGQLEAEGRLDLSATLASLGIDDVTPLTDTEKTATVEQLMSSRAGVYLVGAYTVPGDIDDMPARGSHRPGEAFFYSNWAFNALGTAVEKAGGASIFEMFDRRIARPIGLQDFVVARDGTYRREDVSRHRAYLFDMSSRDRARFGLLYGRGGCWNGQRLLSADWIARSTAPISVEPGPDYGLNWWSEEAPQESGLKQRVFMARGFINQYILVAPEIDAVLVLSVDMKNGRQLMAQGFKPPTTDDWNEVRAMVLAARN